MLSSYSIGTGHFLSSMNIPGHAILLLAVKWFLFNENTMRAIVHLLVVVASVNEFSSTCYSTAISC